MTAKKPPPPFTDRQTASLAIAHAIVSSAGYEILSEEDSIKVAESLASRAVEIVDAVVRAAA